MSYSNTVAINSGFIQDNAGIGKLISYETTLDTDISTYLITITATNQCSTASESYNLDVREGCPTTNTFAPSTLVAQEYTITTAELFYTFDMFSVDPVSCEVFMTFTYNVPDAAAAAAGIVTTFDSATRTISFYYDAGIDFSGGPGVEFMDYDIEITGTAGMITPTSVTGILPLRLKNPCFDPTLITVVQTPLPVGPHEYTLFYYDLEDPYWIMTHDEWTYTTTPIAHQYCGLFSYTATYEGVVADELSMPNMVYHQSNRTFGIYSEDFSLIGMTEVTLSASLTDYPMIVSATSESV